MATHFNDTDLVLALAHEIPPGGGASVDPLRSALARVKDAARRFVAGADAAWGNNDLSPGGRARRLKTLAGEALPVIDAAAAVLEKGRADLKTLEGALAPDALAVRAAMVSKLDAGVREARAAEVRSALLPLEVGGRALELARLVEADKGRSLEAIASVVDSPLPLEVGQGQLEAIAKSWVEKWDASRSEAPDALRLAVSILDAAVSRTATAIKRAAEGSIPPEPILSDLGQRAV